MKLTKILPSYRRLAHGAPTLLFLCGSLVGFSAIHAAEPVDLARVMPESAVVYVEVTRPEVLLEKALDPQLLETLGRSQGVKDFYDSDKFRQLKIGLGLIEARMNAKWPALARDLAGSLHLAFEPQSKTAVFILRAKQPEVLASLHSTLVDLVELDAASKGKPSPVKSQDYQGTAVWSFAEGEHHAIVDDLYLASNQTEALQAALDRLKDPARAGLAGRPEYAAAKAQVPAGQTAWSLVRLEPLRQLPKADKLLSEKSNNPLTELLVGGVLDRLASSPVVVSSLHVDEHSWQWITRLPAAEVPTAEKRSWFFAKEGQAALPPLRPKGTIASISLYRDISGMWIGREELFDEATVAKMAQADAGLGLFFSGRDFGQQVLGELGPRWQIVIARQEFAEGQPTPAIRLPAVAVVLQMKQPEAFATHLKLAYQNTVGLINLASVQQGKPQLLLGSEEYQGVTIAKATYLADPAGEPQAADIVYNASPSCAQVGDRFIFASTTGIVRDLIDALKQPGAAEPTAANFALEVDVKQIAAALDDNRAALVSQNMLKEGHSREQAEQEVGLFLELLRLVERGSLELISEKDALVLKAAINTGK